MGSIRLLMALAVENELTEHQMDVTTAFLNGDIEEELYMELPELLEEILLKIAKEEKQEIKNIKKEEDASKMLDQIKEENNVR